MDGQAGGGEDDRLHRAPHCDGADFLRQGDVIHLIISGVRSSKHRVASLPEDVQTVIQPTYTWTTPHEGGIQGAEELVETGVEVDLELLESPWSLDGGVVSVSHTHRTLPRFLRVLTSRRYLISQTLTRYTNVLTAALALSNP